MVKPAKIAKGARLQAIGRGPPEISELLREELHRRGMTDAEIAATLRKRKRREVLELIKSLKGQHTVVLSTHILADGKAICEQVLIIHRGKIVADDTMANLTGGKDTGLEDKFIQLTAE